MSHDTSPLWGAKPKVRKRIEQTRDGRRDLFECLKVLRAEVGNKHVIVKWMERTVKVRHTRFSFDKLIVAYRTAGLASVLGMTVDKSGNKRRRV